LERDLRRRRAQPSDAQQQGDQGRRQGDGELGGDGAAFLAEPAASSAHRACTPGGARHETVSARRTRSVRMPRTSSERMITTSRPAKATAAIVVIAYSAVAAPVSSVNSCAARLLVSRGRSFSFMCFFF